MRAHERLMVVPYEEQKNFKLIVFVLLLLLTIGALIGGYYWGQQQALKERAALSSRVSDLLKRNAVLDNQYQASLQKIANLETSKQINSHAEQDVKKVILALKEENRQLEEELTFYKQIMAPEKKKGKYLKVDRVVMSEGAAPGKVHYQVILTKQGNNRRFITGNFLLKITGTQNAQPVEGAIIGDQFTLKPTSDKTTVKQFKFRYFQEFEGEFSLPEDFQPKTVEIKVVGKLSKKKEIITTSYDWQLEKG